jgi:sulfatase maturation enzyme AslB (radical SAM superfamily)
MAGVVIGSIITRYQTVSGKVRAVAATVNNECNLHCPHCYLQYHGPKRFISDAHQHGLVNENYEHLGLIGMEPLVSRAHAAQTMKIARRAKSAGKTTSLMTNGFGMQFLDQDDLEVFDFVDVSFDGGSESYRGFRGASFAKLLTILSKLNPRTTEFNALNTICSHTINCIDDMILSTNREIFRKVYFSPYVVAMNHGENSTKSVPLPSLLRHLAENWVFREDPRTILLIDAYHMLYEDISRNQITDLITALDIREKVYLVPFTPLTLGIVRVTYEGQILAPETAIHPARYGESSFEIGNQELAQAYNAFVVSEPTKSVTWNREVPVAA